VTDGFLWCPHCKNPHPFSARVCPRTRRSLGRSMHRESGMRPAERGLVGTTLENKYRVSKLIGAGGMGCVYEAENLLLRRKVAIKVVGGARSNEALLRLRREAELVAATHHPNICDIYDVGTLPDGSPYLVLERLVGETLAALLRREKRLSEHAALDVFSQLLSALDAAHRARIIHRDLKPENVFLSRRIGCPPLVKLMDFGFAKDLTGSRARVITRPGHALGTPRYMAPEQLLAEPVDARTDLFAVGVMLFESLTGAHPFQADSVAELHRNVLRQPPFALRGLRPNLPAELEQVLSCTLARAPGQRFASATQLQRALVGAMALVPEEEDIGVDVDFDAEPVSETVPMRVGNMRASSGATPL
jgi:eukaryotic-like serine/threonine-protein kinase